MPTLEHGWAVVKFGGSSVATAERWAAIDGIVRRHLETGRRVVVVCSALAGVTDRLVMLDAIRAAGGDLAPALADLERTHLALAADLGVDGARLLAAPLASLARAAARDRGSVSPAASAALLAHGELLSSRIGGAFLAGRCGAVVADARALLVAEPEADPIARYLSARCPDVAAIDVRRRLAGTGAPVVVTQGFIARGAAGGTVLLGRGGSDASAAYLAAALDAELLEIWSDVPGLFTADPRQVSDARLLRRLDYAEAHALARLGARALHPRAIEPCRRRGIVLRLGWTAHPEVEGTRIGALRGRRGPRGITARREVALIGIERPRASHEVGFIAAVGEITTRRRVTIEHIASSPDEIRIAVDLGSSPSAREELGELVGELGGVGRTTRWSSVGSVSAVGARHAPAAFRHADAQLVAHAADGSHVSVVVDRGLVPRLLSEAHAELFEGSLDPAVFGPRWDELHGGVIAGRGGTRCLIRA